MPISRNTMSGLILQQNAFENGKTAKTFESRARAFEMSEAGAASTGAIGNEYALYVRVSITITTAWLI